MQKLEQENQDLKRRLDSLEEVVKKEGLMPSEQPGSKAVSALSGITISGFVSTSFFHDTSDPHTPGSYSPGYLWSRYNNAFTLNKFKLTLASPPVERSGDKFDAAFRTSLIIGDDAPYVNTSPKNPTAGAAIGAGDTLLREAYVELNVPIGTGLNVRAGELISLLNYESGDGGAANNNFSQGYQWFYTGNPPGAGVQLGYTFTDWFGMKVRVQNGLFQGPVDNNSSKTFMGSLDFKPTDKIWFSFLGFGGREDFVAQSLWGASFLGGWQATPELSFGTELDYFDFFNPSGPVKGNSPVWSTGLWTDYNFTKKVGVGLRAEFLSDKDGADVSAGDPLGFLNPAGTGQDLSSVALTLNLMPVPYIKIQPEVRFDHTSWAGGFVPGKDNRVIFGAGVSYLF